MDYYLVPGAVWSVLRKGERVQIIGRAKDTGWYRCMALRDSNVKLDKAPFAFLKSISKRQSGITPELIEEEYSWRSSSDIDPLLKVTLYLVSLCMCACMRAWLLSAWASLPW